LKVIKSKVKGRPVKLPPDEPARAEVVDLMERLRDNLK
jgi:non-homologous end joining protein Ku